MWYNNYSKRKREGIKMTNMLRNKYSNLVRYATILEENNFILKNKDVVRIVVWKDAKGRIIYTQKRNGKVIVYKVLQGEVDAPYHAYVFDIYFNVWDGNFETKDQAIEAIHDIKRNLSIEFAASFIIFNEKIIEKDLKTAETIENLLKLT
jgi:hypothetical protein